MSTKQETRKLPEHFTSISISFLRKNGLILKRIEERERTGYNLSLNQILDKMLEEGGVPELTEHELVKRSELLNKGGNHQ